MKIPPANQASPDERLLAALSHGSILFFHLGLIAPLLLWAYQRQKSSFVAFHALQALAYQMLWTVYASLVAIVFSIATSLGTILSIAFLSSNNHVESMSPAMFVFQVLSIGALFLAIGAYVLIGLLGAGLTLARREFRYPLLGHWMEKYLRVEPATPSEMTS